MKLAIISIILEQPEKSQEKLNKLIAEYSDLIKARMGIPFEKQEIAAICLMVLGEMDKINAFTGKLGRLEQITIKTAVSGKEV